MKYVIVSVYMAAIIFSFSAESKATLFTPGNIIVSNSPFGDSDLFEYTTAGTQVQMVPIIPLNDARDLVIDGNGNVQIYNGTFSPVLTSYKPSSNSFNSVPFAGWSTVNNLTYGGIGAFGRYVFATDMETANDGSPKGVIRFHIDTNQAERFATNLQPIDLYVGLDGLLYTLSEGNAPNGGGNRVDVYNPETLAFIRTFTLPEEHRGIAINSDGHVFTAQRDNVSRVVHYDENGVFVDSINDPGVGGFADIDINRDGELLIASHGGTVLLTDVNLDTITFFQTRSSNGFNFAAWVQKPVPEPGSIVLLIGLTGFCLRRRSNRRH